MFAQSPLTLTQTAAYSLEFEMEKLLASTSTDAAQANLYHQAMQSSLESDSLGVPLSQRDDQFWVGYPIAVFVLKP